MMDVLGEPPTKMQVSEVIERIKENLGHIRLASRYNSAERLANHLNKNYGTDISRSSINRWESSNGPSPSVEYLIGLSFHLGIEPDILLGLRSFGDRSPNTTGVDNPELAEIIRMYSALSDRSREIIELQLYALYEYDIANK